MGVETIGLGFLAGMLSTLSPCVLPLLPLVMGGALAAHRFGMMALTFGMVVSFVSVGLFVATVGFSIGLDGDVFRTVTAVLLAVLGVALLSDAVQQRFAAATSGFGNAANRLADRFAPNGVAGQFAIGLMLGAIWSPCVGPTLGAASLLAAQGQNLGAAAITMGAFGLGAAIPPIAIGSMSRELLKRWRGQMMGAGKAGKRLFGAGAVIVSVLILTGSDRKLEAFLVGVSPAWLTDLTTRF
ncbi:MAG: cytochrome c biogenesis CcdA family protein [Rhodospirillales bacterium]